MKYTLTTVEPLSERLPKSNANIDSCCKYNMTALKLLSDGSGLRL